MKMFLSYIGLHVLCFLCLWQTTKGIPTGTLEPKVNNVLEGSIAEFTCTVTGRDRVNSQIWWQGQTRAGELWRYSATHRTIIYGDPSFLENLGFQTNTSSVEEVFILQLFNATKRDNQSISCIHSSMDTTYTLDDNASARLVVWTKPTENPRCSYTYVGEIPIIISSGGNYPIILSCSIEGGDPQPQLTWYKNDRNSLLQIGGPSTNSLNINHLITATDLGREYVCQAAIDATPDEPLTCQIIPYNPMPEIAVTSEKQTYQIGERISIFCNNTGVSTANTTYSWYINDVLTTESSDGSTMIMNTMKSSTIYIANYTFSSNIVEVICEGIIPNVARANATVSLTVMRTSDQTTIKPTMMTQMPSEQGLMMIIIIAAAAGGTFVIIIIVIIVCCVYSKCKHLGKEVDTENIKTDSVRVKNTSEPGTSSETPKNPKTIETANEEANKKQMDNSSAVYDDVPTDNIADPSKFKANVEGLAYADLEIAPQARGNVKNEHIIQTETATVYSEVKM